MNKVGLSAIVNNSSDKRRRRLHYILITITFSAVEAGDVAASRNQNFLGGIQAKFEQK